MNIVQLSNYFNLIAQQVGFLGYHYGYESDMYRNVQNNTNPQNSVGNRYPYVLFEPPTWTSTVQKATTTRYGCRLNFFGTQHYNNDGSINTDQAIEQVNALRILVLDFIEGVKQVGILQGFAIEALTVNFDVQEMQTADRLIQIVATFGLQAKETCSTFVFNPALVIAPYAYPPSDSVDYEKLNQ